MLLRPLSAALLLFTALGSSRPATAAEPTARQRIAIIKADDVRGVNAKWDRFIALSQERDIVVSLGIITESLATQDPKYVAWIKKWADSGKVEFWNHGWDHKSWTSTDGKKLSEFGGSGLEHQKDHLLKAQAAFKTATGSPYTIFGSPFNAMDGDTARALNEIPELKMIYCYPGSVVNAQLKGKVLLPMSLRGEHDGTSKPNFPKFKEDYQKKDSAALTFAAIQFHPFGFSEEGFKHYTDILDFLKAEGWTFVLPTKYLELQANAAAPAASK
ncbi:DUF2334 domain-containing protein [Verrucomicrobium sp. BvORR106]|uniref:DUF2334 domain-containing protein n=1 Tax=Verrucomicrobium sp. BvORR106 TaxID=1403819 RepID=UPI000570F783|nr:DUF2334 domain-containing protein [Verrucomicrobium sp. BvORR106]